jgi:hypothetical protein
MPFRHVVMFKWEDHVDDGHIDEVRSGLSALPLEIDVIRNYVHGSDVGVSEGNYDYVVVADFDNVNDYRTYRDHPQHVLLIEELIKGNVAQRAAVQYQTGPR